MAKRGGVAIAGAYAGACLLCGRTVGYVVRRTLYVQTPSRPWLHMRAVSLAGSRRWKALESLTAGSSSPEPPGQLIATDMGAIRSQSVGWV